jgi:DNA repair and recombination RAD54-like protein
MLSGTPLQNELQEFYSMVSFCNPGLLGPPGAFRKRFEVPILAGREPGASDEEVGRGVRVLGLG